MRPFYYGYFIWSTLVLMQFTVGKTTSFDISPILLDYLIGRAGQLALSVSGYETLRSVITALRQSWPPLLGKYFPNKTHPFHRMQFLPRTNGRIVIHIGHLRLSHPWVRILH